MVYGDLAQDPDIVARVLCEIAVQDTVAAQCPIWRRPIWRPIWRVAAPHLAGRIS